MTNPKGPRFERVVRDYLNEVNLHAERTGSELLDEGDIHFGMHIVKGEWMVECKDQAGMDFPGYLRQLEASMVRTDGIPFKGFVAVKKRGQNVAESYAVMRLERMRQLATYVMLLETCLMEAFGAELPVPEELRAYLGRMATTEENEHLIPVFGEFVGDPSSEVTADPEPEVELTEREFTFAEFIAAMMGTDPELNPGA